MINKDKLLKARCEDSLDDEFESIFDLVHDARDSGDTKEVESLLEWMAEPDIIKELSPVIFLSALRLTFTMRKHISEPWKHLVNEAWVELVKRETNKLGPEGAGERANTLLYGLIEV